VWLVQGVLRVGMLRFAGRLLAGLSFFLFSFFPAFFEFSGRFCSWSHILSPGKFFLPFIQSFLFSSFLVRFLFLDVASRISWLVFSRFSDCTAMRFLVSCMSEGVGGCACCTVLSLKIARASRHEDRAEESTEKYRLAGLLSVV